MYHHIFKKPANRKRILLRVIHDDPKNARAYFNLATVCEYTGEYDEAIDYCRKAVHLNPGSGFYYKFLSEVYRKMEEGGDL